MFSGAMVRALLAGRKTQTRRLASSPLRRVDLGDRLWVREAVSCGGVFSDVVELRYKAHENAGHTSFVEQVPVDRAPTASKLPAWPTYRPSIHMPRWASRATLIVDAIRVQRLKALTEADAEAEGVVFETADPPFWYVPGILPHSLTAVGIEEPASRRAERCYGKLWNLLHSAEGQRWDDDPEVVALTFRVVPANIDQVPA